MIRYFQKDIRYDVRNKRILNKWIQTVASEYGKKCREINIIFCSDPVILQLNRQFLKHDYYTDIITFDYCGPNYISGDLYIGIDTVRENAVEYKEGFERELFRVIIHGILHLLSLNDHTEEERAEMRHAENCALSFLDNVMENRGKGK